MWLLRSEYKHVLGGSGYRILVEGRELRVTESQAGPSLVPGSCEAKPGSGVENQPYSSPLRGFVCSCPGPPPGRGFL